MEMKGFKKPEVLTRTAKTGLGYEGFILVIGEKHDFRFYSKIHRVIRKDAMLDAKNMKKEFFEVNKFSG